MRFYTQEFANWRLSPLTINDIFRPVEFVDEGMEVIIPFINNGNRTGLRCIVSVAAGNWAKVVNEKYGIDNWWELKDLRIEKNG